MIVVRLNKRQLYGNFSKASSRKSFFKTKSYGKNSKDLDLGKIHNNKSFSFKKAEHKRFTELSAKLKSFVPGVGSYKKLEKEKILSPKPRALRRSRR